MAGSGSQEISEMSRVPRVSTQERYAVSSTGFHGLVSPFDPRQEALDILLLNRSTALNAQGRGSIAIAVKVIADITLFEQLDDLLRHIGLRFWT